MREPIKLCPRVVTGMEHALKTPERLGFWELGGEMRREIPGRTVACSGCRVTVAPYSGQQPARSTLPSTQAQAC
jgi:hypothetical protein